MHEVVLVSVIITTCNRCELLPRAIDSVINQTYKNIEIIIIDDSSTDKTQDVIKNYQKEYSSIIYIRNDSSFGANVSRNKGIKMAKGKFIAGLDDDDEFMPNRIELLLKNYDDKYAFITSNNIIINETSFTTSILPFVKLENMLSNNILYNQALVEKHRIIEVGLYDEKLTACQDYDLWMRLIIKYGEVKVIKETTQIIHVITSLNRISSKSKSKYFGYFNFYKKYKYLMDEYARKQHLMRISDIRNRDNNLSKLAVKLLINKIISSGLDNFSLYGVNNITEQIIQLMKKQNIKINFIIDKYKFGKNFSDFNIISLKEAMESSENHFIICSVRYFEDIKNDILENNYKNNNLTILHI